MVDEQRIPILSECERMCRQLGLNPLGLIASGSLLIAAERERAGSIVERLQTAGVEAATIGEIVPREDGCTIRTSEGIRKPLPAFARDEIARLFRRHARARVSRTAGSSRAAWGIVRNPNRERGRRRDRLAHAYYHLPVAFSRLADAGCVPVRLARATVTAGGRSTSLMVARRPKFCWLWFRGTAGHYSGR